MEIQKLKEGNIENIVAWCKGKNADFLAQWAGRGYVYPLTEEQIKNRLSDGAEIYEADLDGKIVGTIEIMEKDTETGNAYIGRFILNPALTGQGLGTRVLKAFMGYCKSELGLRKVRISVFDFNTGAHKCYKKCGFSEVGTVIRPNGWKAIEMDSDL